MEPVGIEDADGDVLQVSSETVDFVGFRGVSFPQAVLKFSDVVFNLDIEAVERLRAWLDGFLLEWEE